MTCEDGLPTWGYALYFPLWLRSRWVEKVMLGGTWTLVSMDTFFGSLDHFDWFTDGAFPVQAPRALSPNGSLQQGNCSPRSRL